MPNIKESKFDQMRGFFEAGKMVGFIPVIKRCIIDVTL